MREARAEKDDSHEKRRNQRRFLNWAAPHVRLRYLFLGGLAAFAVVGERPALSWGLVVKKAIALIVGFVTQGTLKAAEYLIGGAKKSSPSEVRGSPSIWRDMPEEKPSDHVEKVLADLKGIEDRKQALIDSLLRQRAKL